MFRWYVVQTHSRAEPTAAAQLGNQGFAAYLPRYLKSRRHARRIDSVPAPLFPGYLFVGMDVAAARWRAIHSTVGVRRLVCNGEQPTPVPDGVVDAIRAREDDGGFVIMARQAAFKQGDAVRVAGGPFDAAEGIFEAIDAKQRIVVLLDLLGRQVRARVPLEAVQALA